MRPVIVVQCDSLNQSALKTVVCVPLTSNLRWADAPGGIRLAAAATGLPKDSIAQTAQLYTADRSALLEYIGQLSVAQLDAVFRGIDVVLGRS